MSAERTQLLNDVGFTWEVKNKKASDDYNKLVQVLGDLKWLSSYGYGYGYEFDMHTYSLLGWLQDSLHVFTLEVNLK